MTAVGSGRHLPPSLLIHTISRGGQHVNLEDASLRACLLEQRPSPALMKDAVVGLFRFEASGLSVRCIRGDLLDRFRLQAMCSRCSSHRLGVEVKFPSLIWRNPRSFYITQSIAAGTAASALRTPTWKTYSAIGREMVEWYRPAGACNLEVGRMHHGTLVRQEQGRHPKVPSDLDLN